MLACAVMTRTTVCGDSSRARRSTASPSAPGIRMSVTTTAKSRSSIAAQRRRAVGGGLDLVAGVAQDLGEALAHAGLVVGDEDGDAHAIRLYKSPDGARKRAVAALARLGTRRFRRAANSRAGRQRRIPAGTGAPRATVATGLLGSAA